MAKAVKFSTLIEDKTLKELKKYTEESGRKVGNVVNEALEQYLQRLRVRPAFHEALDVVINENDELLKRLAK